MTTAFGGGTGDPTGNTYNPPTVFTDLFGARNKMRFLVDPGNAKIEMIFDLVTGSVAIKSGDQVLDLPFIKL